MSKKLLKNQNGAVFLITMICVFLMTMVAGYIYQASSYNSHYINQLRRSTEAQMIADAGLAKALSTIRNNWNAVGGSFPTTTLGAGSYSTSVVSSGGRYLAKTTGTVQNHSRTASAEVKTPAASALNYVLAGGGSGEHEFEAGSGQSSGTITGNIYMAGPLELEGPSSGGVLTITGSVYSQSTIEVEPNVTISGTQNQNWSTTVAFPTVDFSFYQNIATANSQYFNGNKTYASGTLPGSPAGGVIFVNGDITIEGTQTTTASIIATGNIMIQKSGSTYPGVTINQYQNYPALMTQNGSISYTSTGNGGAFLTTAGLIYSGNNFTIPNANHTTFNITGSILARGIIDTSGVSSYMNWTVAYAAQNPPGLSSSSSTMSIVSYNQ